jgi:hypothetical protein
MYCMSMAKDPLKIVQDARKGVRKKTYSFSINEEIGEAFIQIADNEGVSNSALAENVFKDFVADYKAKKKSK